MNIEYKNVEPLNGGLTAEQVIERVGGGDKTDGSCSSLAFAYIANQNGMDVLDFRGGQSRAVFSKPGNIKEIASLPGVNGQIIKNTNDFKSVNELLKSVEPGKEYYLATGKHAAVIRKGAKGFEYLELQSPKENGFKKLTTVELKKRFKAQKTHVSYGIKLEASSVLIESKSLAKSPEFKNIMGYINTSSTAQQKGADGSVR